MDKVVHQFVLADRFILHRINKHFSNTLLNRYFQSITHLGGALFTLSTSALLMVLPFEMLQFAGKISFSALILSHIPVTLSKRIFPRKRPYQIIEKLNVTKHVLIDHSFPSGHTTAIFALLTPLILSFPTFTPLFLALALSVAVSRIYLGLHYPSDVVVGMLIGSGTASFLFFI